MNLEALNVLTDHVGNFLETTQMGAEMLRIIGSPRIAYIFQNPMQSLNPVLRIDRQIGEVLGGVHPVRIAQLLEGVGLPASAARGRSARLSPDRTRRSRPHT